MCHHISNLHSKGIFKRLKLNLELNKIIIENDNDWLVMSKLPAVEIISFEDIIESRITIPPTMTSLRELRFSFDAFPTVH